MHGGARRQCTAASGIGEQIEEHLAEARAITPRQEWIGKVSGPEGILQGMAFGSSCKDRLPYTGASHYPGKVPTPVAAPKARRVATTGASR